MTAQAFVPTSTTSTISIAKEPLEKRQLGGAAPGRAAYIASLSAGPAYACVSVCRIRVEGF